jgi:enterochelin esterase-like enzyme
MALAVGGIALIAGVAVVAGGAKTFMRDGWTSDSVVHSELLGRDMPIEVFEPPRACAVQRVLVLFHGAGGDQSQWMEGRFFDGVGIDRIARQLIDEKRIDPVTIVSAFIDDSYGVDSAAADDGYAHGPYERYIVEELIPSIVERYAPDEDAQIYVGGLSMGGFAALNVAFEYPQRFNGVGALSPAFFDSPPADRAWIYKGDGRKSLDDYAASGAGDGLALFLGYGDHDYDWIRNATRGLAETLDERGETTDPVVVAGGHDAATWRQLAEPMLLELFGTTYLECASSQE